jgi:hypothetical protein
MRSPILNVSMDLKNAAGRTRAQEIYFVVVQDSLEGPLSPFALIAVTS